MFAHFHVDLGAMPNSVTGAALNLHMAAPVIAQITNKSQVKKYVLLHFMKHTLAIHKET